MTIYTLKTILNFGRYKGDTVEGILQDDPEYLNWCIDNIEWFELDDEAEAALDDAIMIWDDEDSQWLDEDPGPAFSNLY